MRIFLFRAAKPSLLDDPVTRRKLLSFIRGSYDVLSFRSSLHLEGYFVLQSNTDLHKFVDGSGSTQFVEELNPRNFRGYLAGLVRDSSLEVKIGDWVKITQGPYRGLMGEVDDILGDRVAIKPHLPRGYKGALFFQKQGQMKIVSKLPSFPKILGVVKEEQRRSEVMLTSTVLLIDASFLLYQSHFAFKNLTYGGRSTGGLFGFFRTILSLVEKYEPYKVYVCWDHSIEKKQELYPEYKAGRVANEMKKLVAEDVNLLKSVIHHMGLNHVYAEYSEADDLLAYYAKKFGDRGVIIFSGDRDVLQLVTEKVFVTKGKDILIGKQGVVQEFGVLPTELPFFRAIRGDSSDNLTGVPRFSSERLKVMSSTLSTPDELYTDIEGVRKKYQLSDLLVKKLLDFKREVIRNYRLMTLTGELWGPIHEIKADWDEAIYLKFCEAYGLMQLKTKKDKFQGLSKAVMLAIGGA